MSLSRDEEMAPRGTGRVILGMQSQGLSEMSVSEFQGQRQASSGWKDKDYEEYHRRVRDRAEATAKEIISAAVAEARAIRDRASQEGYRDGLAHCQAQAAAAVEQNADVLAQAMVAVQNVGRELWADYRADVAALVRLVVQKVLRLELDARREDVLASLMDKALDAIDSQRGLTVRVNPQDQELAAGLLERAKAKHPGLERWGIRPDATLEPGGIIVESDRGVVDNSIEGRWKLVEPILEHLSDHEVGDEVDEAMQRAASRPMPAPVAAPEPEPVFDAEPAVPFETAGDSGSAPLTEPEPATEPQPQPEQAAPEADPGAADAEPPADTVDAAADDTPDNFFLEPEADEAPGLEAASETESEEIEAASNAAPSQEDIDAMLAQATDSAPEAAPAAPSQDDVDALLDAGPDEEPEAAAPSQDDIDAMLAQATDAAPEAAPEAPAQPSQDDIDAMLAQATDADAPAPEPKAAPSQDDIDAMLDAAAGGDDSDGDDA